MTNIFGQTTIGKKRKQREEDVTFTRFQVWGWPFSGKSLFSTSFPNPIVLDFERSHDFLRKKKVVEWQGVGYEVQPFDDLVSEDDIKGVIEFLIEVRDAVNNDPDNVYTIVLDGMTLLWDAIKTIYNEVTSEEKVNVFSKKTMKMNEWGTTKSPMHRIRQILSSTRAHKVYISHAKSDWDMTNPNKPKLKTNSKAGTESSFDYEVDVRLEFLKKDDPRNKKHHPHTVYVWKDRTHTFQEGSLVEDPRYQLFEPFIAGNFKRPAVGESFLPENVKQPSSLKSKIIDCLKDDEVMKLMDTIGLPPMDNIEDTTHLRYKSVAKYSGDRDKILEILKERIGEGII